MKNWKKRTVCLTLILTMVLLLFPAHATTPNNKIDSEMEMDVTYDTITVFPDGGKDYKFFVDGVENHYLVPPMGFAPLTASDEDLERYGFPARPDDSDTDSFKDWEELMANYTGTPEPEFAVKIKPYEAEKSSGADMQSRAFAIYSTNWSGYMANLGESSSNFFTQAQMDYIEPTITATNGYCLNSYWVGFGGYNHISTSNMKLVQAGTATSDNSDHYAWYEYISDRGDFVEMIPVSLDVKAGDSIHVYISFQAANNLFSYYIANNTTGKSAASTITLNTASQFDGTTVEWIVERSSNIGLLQNLANYGTITLKNCKATNNLSNTWYNLDSLSSLYQITMTSNGKATGRLLSVPGSVVANNQFTCTWKGYY